MATANLINEAERVITGKESVVIVQNLFALPGGRTLDVTGYTKDLIEAGHLVIQPDGGGDYKPMPLNGAGTAYAALPANHHYAGVVIATKRTKNPQVGILLHGVVNPACMPYPFDTVAAAVKAALTQIQFITD